MAALTTMRKSLGRGRGKSVVAGETGGKATGGAAAPAGDAAGKRKSHTSMMASAGAANASGVGGRGAASPRLGGAGKAGTPGSPGLDLRSARRKDVKVWVSSTPDRVFELGVVTGREEGGEKLTVETASGRVVSAAAASVFPANVGAVEADLTRLAHISDATVLHSLESRSLEDKPYTWLGPVLVSVNPLRELEMPCAAGDVDAIAAGPSPFALAENACKLLQFHLAQGKKRSQSVIISGESGSGKTVLCKFVLQHVVKRLFATVWRGSKGGADSAPLDERLLATSPVLESLGNAATLRNDNSSRFGRFLKLHVDGDGFIEGASVRTYLLERSRVSLHLAGERSFHVFYQMLAGLDKAGRKRLHLEGDHFRYLQSGGGGGARTSVTEELTPQDSPRFVKLLDALRLFGLSGAEVLSFQQVLAGVLLIGNADLAVGKGDKVSVAPEGAGALADAAGLLGLSADALGKLFLERSLAVGKEVTTVPLDLSQAAKARDAVAKELYGRLFDAVISRINRSLADSGDAEPAPPSLFVGTLDIFGFESFEVNDLEQLLINFANERLQASFYSHIMVAEADVLAAEGLVLGGVLIAGQAPRRTGPGLGPDPGLGGSKVELLKGVLALVDAEGKGVDASDANLPKKIRAKYSEEDGVRPEHPSRQAACFTVAHFAGAVTYTVGSFLEKNDHSLPKESATVLQGAANEFLAGMMRLGADPSKAALSKKAAAAAAKFGNTGKDTKGKAQLSVSKQFTSDLEELVELLDSTACSFVRCIKPNATMRRGAAAAPPAGKKAATKAEDDSDDEDERPAAAVTGQDRPWFDRRYVCSQLKSLSITAAATSLREGLPLRLGFEEVQKMFRPLFSVSAKATKALKTHGEGKALRGAAATLHAFQLPKDEYKVGITSVFFSATATELLQKAQHSAEQWAQAQRVFAEGKAPAPKKNHKGEMEDENGELRSAQAQWELRFHKLLVRRRWRRAGYALVFARALSRVAAMAEDRHAAASVLQRMARGMLARQQLRRFRRAALMGQKMYRGAKGRAEALRRIEKVRLGRETKAREQRERELRERDERSRIRKELGEREQGVRSPSIGTAATTEESKDAGDRSRPRPKSARGSTVAAPGSPQKIPTAPPSPAGPGEAKKRSSRRSSQRQDRERPRSKSPGAVLAALSELSGPRAYERVRKMSLVPIMFTDESLHRAIIESDQDTASKLAMSYESRKNRQLSQANASLAAAQQQQQQQQQQPAAPTPLALATVGCKLAVKKAGAWKRRYLVLNTPENTVTYYTFKSKTEKRDKLGQFRINPGDYVPAPRLLASHTAAQQPSSEPPRPRKAALGSLFTGSTPGKYVIEVRSGKISSDTLGEDRSLFLAFDTFENMASWRDAIEATWAYARGIGTGPVSTAEPAQQSTFGEQVRCKNKHCRSINNTLYGLVCLECGTPLKDAITG
jgi:myosin heavy subunit